MGHANGSNYSYSMAEAPSGSLKNSISPIPYLFGGLALMLALIGMALLILACSYNKSYSSNGDAERAKRMAMEVNSEPKIVVIMAGETNPTYMAKPAPSIQHIQEQN